MDIGYNVVVIFAFLGAIALGVILDQKICAHDFPKRCKCGHFHDAHARTDPCMLCECRDFDGDGTVTYRFKDEATDTDRFRIIGTRKDA